MLNFGNRIASVPSASMTIGRMPIMSKVDCASSGKKPIGSASSARKGVG